jgi:dienelactone hydrolase
LVLGFVAAIVLTGYAVAEIKSETVLYRQGDIELEGYLAYNPSLKTPRPGVLVVHEWYGLGPYAKKRADQLAELGYIAFAVDIYGKGVRPQNSEEAGKEAGKYRADRQLLRARINAGLETLKKQKGVDPLKIAAIGYCFGGGTVLELARSGADIRGVVSFHGSLDTPNPDDAKRIKAKVLVLHGGADPYVTAAHVAAFQDEMTKAYVDWQIISYGGAVHSFTNPEAGSDPSKGAAYHASADRRSWEAMKQFFGEIFQ